MALRLQELHTCTMYITLCNSPDTVIHTFIVTYLLTTRMYDECTVVHVIFYIDPRIKSPKYRYNRLSRVFLEITVQPSDFCQFCNYHSALQLSGLIMFVTP